MSSLVALDGDKAPPQGRPISVPGCYRDIPEAVYHADPVQGGSLSSSGARTLRDCPARFKWELDHPPMGDKRRHFDVGSAAHRLVLGAGPGLAVIEASDWRTKAAKEELEAARAAGKIPVNRAEYDMVTGMAAALQAHETAAALLDPAHGAAELTIAWVDPKTEVTCRARLDWLRYINVPRTVVCDYKTTASAKPSDLAKSVANFGYYMQDPWYLDGVTALELGDESTAFVFIAQEKSPPFPVTVFQIDAEARRLGRMRNHEARLQYLRCVTTGSWPAYSDAIEILSLPSWAY